MLGSTTVRVQLNGGWSETAVQGEVPANRSMYMLEGHAPFYQGKWVSALIVDPEGLPNPYCRAFTADGDQVGETIWEGDDPSILQNAPEAVIAALMCSFDGDG